MECEVMAKKVWPIFEQVCRKCGVTSREYPEVEPVFWDTVFGLYLRQESITNLNAYGYRSFQYALGRFLKSRSRRRSLEMELHPCNQ